MDTLLNSSHSPVMLKEVLEVLNPKSDSIYIDATFGAGGYTRAILNSKNCRVYGIDRDNNVIKFASAISKTYNDRFSFINGEFSNLEELLLINNINGFDGIVFDIGVSSMQLDNAERGFSFSKPAPLDMRMNQTTGITAKDIVNSMLESDLADIIYKYGGERKSRKIAHCIVNARQVAKIETTDNLANIILNAVGKYNDSIHPATRTFQALRIVVNDELTELEIALKTASKYINKGGKIIVVTFHSLEDKIVKSYFNSLCGRETNINRHLPQLIKQSEINFEFLVKGTLSASTLEIKNNPRSRSAKLRAIQRIK